MNDSSRMTNVGRSKMRWSDKAVLSAEVCSSAVRVAAVRETQRWLKKWREAHIWLQQCERHIGVTTTQRQQWEHKIEAEVALASRGSRLTRMSIFGYISYLSVIELQCSVSSSSAMGNMMHHVEREL